MLFFKRKTEKQITGSQGEKLATEYLKKNGYRILERNFRSGRNEIDIVAADKGVIVFVEVKMFYLVLIQSL